jgi:hypothetical protein
MEGSEMPRLIAIALIVFLAGCASTPSRPETAGATFPKPVVIVNKAVLDALAVTGFDIKKAEPLYVEGFRPRKVGLFVGSGGESVGVWLEPLTETSTRVRVDTARSLFGIAGQKNWNQEIINEIEKAVAKR